MKLLTLLLAISSVSFSVQETELRLTVDAYSIKCGEATTLRWKAGGAQQVFILGVGKVNAEGETRVSPVRTVTYTLLAEGPAGLRSKSITVTVEGCQKGDDDYPDDEKFETQLTGKRPAPSLVAFLEQTHEVLQDRMRLTVKNYQSSEGVYIFKTKVSERRASSDDDRKNKIGARRVSYMVEIRPSGQGEVSYNIKTFTMRKKILKETWTVENDPSVRRAEAEKLRELLEQI